MADKSAKLMRLLVPICIGKKVTGSPESFRDGYFQKLRAYVFVGLFVLIRLHFCFGSSLPHQMGIFTCEEKRVKKQGINHQIIEKTRINFVDLNPFKILSIKA
jgi:hypothetical protein